MPKLEVTLKVDKVTKGAVRYREIEKDPPVDHIFPVLYLRNSAALALHIPPPDTIKVTVEVV